MSLSNRLDPRPQIIPSSVPILLGIGVIALSSAPIFIRLSQGSGLPSLVIAAGRLSLAAALFTPAVLKNHTEQLMSLGRRDRYKIAFAGILLAIHFLAAVSSFEYTSVMISIVVFSSTPLWTAIIESLLLGTRLSKQVLWGLVIAMFGGLLIGTAGAYTDSTSTIPAVYQRDFLGGGLALTGAVTFAMYMTIGRDLQKDEKVPTILYVWLVYGSAGILLLSVVMINRIPLTGFASSGYLWLFALTIFPQVVGHSALNYAVGYLSATLVTMITLLEPVISTLMAYLIFSEVPLPLQLLGCIIILTGVAIGNFRRRNRTN